MESNVHVLGSISASVFRTPKWTPLLNGLATDSAPKSAQKSVRFVLRGSGENEVEQVSPKYIKALHANMAEALTCVSQEGLRGITMARQQRTCATAEAGELAKRSHRQTNFTRAVFVRDQPQPCGISCRKW